MVHIVGAGCGAADLITVRGLRLLREADLVIYAGSLVNRELLCEVRPDCVCLDSAKMTLEQVVEAVMAAEQEKKTTVRLHTGDPCLYGAIREQLDEFSKRGIDCDICPGVSSFTGAAAGLKAELTLPGVSQTVILTRMPGRTEVPQGENFRSLAEHHATMAVFLSAGMISEMETELLSAGYGPETAAAIVYKATWPEEKLLRCTVSTLAETADREKIEKTAMILIGDALNGGGVSGYGRSKLYHPRFTTGYRRGAEAEKKKISVVGIGPGEHGSMTFEADRVLRECDVIAGYTVYVDLIRQYYPNKELVTTSMRQEKERCELAFAEAEKGRHVAMVCSGDAGVYGMAGLILEIGRDYPEVEVEVIPGITAALSGSALLGAPLMHDFAVVSLSDLLTPWEKIEARLRLAAQADFSICLYNPSSKKRAGYLRRACEIMMEWKDGDTVCGVTKNIGREGETSEVMTLRELAGYEADMFTTVFIGNSRTAAIKDGTGVRMVTPRGYKL